MQQQKIHYFRDFKKIWHLIGPNKKIFIIAIIMTFFKTTFSIVSSIVIGLFIQGTFEKIASPGPISPEQTEIIKKALSELLIGCAIVFAIYVLYSIVYASVNIMVLKVSYSLGQFIKSLLFFKINKLPYKIIESKMSGELLSRSTLDANTLALNFAFAMGNVFTLPAILICTYIALFIISPYLVLISFVFQFLGIFASYMFSYYSAPKFTEKQKKLGELNGIIGQDIENRKVIKMFETHNINIQKFNSKSEEEFKTNTKAEMLIGMVWPSNEFFQFVLSSFLYLIGVIFVWYDIDSGSIVFPKIEVGTLTSFCLLILFLMSDTANSLKLVGVVQKVFVSFNRVNEVLEYDEVKETGNKQLLNCQGNIKFENVSFGYNADKMVLKNISFDIKKNQKIAIVGPTGSGKTTIINLLSRFYEINNGKITIDNQNIQDLSLESLRENISLVLQDSFLFSESIYNNIKHGNKKATKEDVIKAAKLANIDYFISQLKDGYDTIVSENLDFSQGQLQLISIARAILSDAKILIMDEATSYVDTKTEKDIQNAIVHASNNKTVIMIAHRLSTIMDADKIIVIKNGEIEEVGNHDELLKLKGFYYQLYKLNYVNE